MQKTDTKPVGIQEFSALTKAGSGTIMTMLIIRILIIIKQKRGITNGIIALSAYESTYSAE